ncbi:hypothetical protein BMI86_01025 [Thioclava sp. DLFJ5-1]|uniref:hypothetical protein n=1 Tax=Thioclava sp. DLFJ5-1 TaxID=1915314 RepID=UPI0009987FE6|nr:hypothetical protein [Thioclava sp. DLFJ5-1]OOY21194.1 hypothetical protein BMI86_01025 [Thioclava sp. DLFJ5-1]
MTKIHRPAPSHAVSFRQILRHETSAAHEAGEAQFSQFFAAPEQKLGWFLAAQAAGLGVLARHAAPGALCAGLLSDLLDRLDRDLARLGRPVHPVPAPDAEQGLLDPLAVDYLVLGSRLGTQVIDRKVFAETPAEAKPLYFQAPAAGALWKRHCATLDALRPAEPRATRIVADATRGFHLFAQAVQAQGAGTTSDALAPALASNSIDHPRPGRIAADTDLTPKEPT